MPAFVEAHIGEVRGATWGEFDLHAGICTIPGARTTTKEPHRVPLSSAGLALVEALKEQKQRETQVFPKPRKMLCDMTLTRLLRRLKAKGDTPRRGAIAHGDRSSAIGPTNMVTPATLRNVRSRIPSQTRSTRAITERICLGSAAQ